jgi:hypothetical protein
MRTLVKSAIAAGIAAGCMSSGAQAADYEQEIGLIVAGAVENWNGISFIDGGSTGSDTTIVSGHSGRVSLPLGPNLSLQSDIDVEWNSRAFAGDDNSAAGNIWNFQGGAHLSWRDPSRSLFGIFAAAGEERHNDTDPDINYDFTVIGGEAQFYIDNTTLYIHASSALPTSKPSAISLRHGATRQTSAVSPTRQTSAVSPLWTFWLTRPMSAAYRLTNVTHPKPSWSVAQISFIRSKTSPV